MADKFSSHVSPGPFLLLLERETFLAELDFFAIGAGELSHLAIKMSLFANYRI